MFTNSSPRTLRLGMTALALLTSSLLVQSQTFCLEGNTTMTFTLKGSEINKLAYISAGSFDGITEPVALEFPAYIEYNGVRYQVEGIAKDGFSGNKLISSITFPKTNFFTIHSDAFENCSNLTEVNLGDVHDIDDYAFYGCSKLTSIIIPKSVKSMGLDVFNGCKNLIDVIIADGDTPLKMYRRTFNGYMKNLYLGRELNCEPYLNFVDPFADPDYSQMPAFSFDKVTIGNQLTTIPSFQNVSINELEIGASVTEIPDNCFNKYTGGQLTIPSSVTKIGAKAFYNCKNLWEVKFGTGITEIGTEAFGNCTNLYELYFTSTTLPSLEQGPFPQDQYLSIQVLDPYNIPDDPAPQEDTENGEPQAPTASNKWSDYNVQQLWYAGERVEITEEDILSTYSTSSNSKPNTIKLNATLYPQVCYVSDITWKSSDPAVATVDHNGLVTILDDTKECYITAASLFEGVEDEYDIYPSNPSVTAIDTVTEDSAGNGEIIGTDGEITRAVPNHIYNIQGMLLKKNASQADVDNLPAGLYIIGGKKVFVK